VVVVCVDCVPVTDLLVEPDVAGVVCAAAGRVRGVVVEVRDGGVVVGRVVVGRLVVGRVVVVGWVVVVGRVVVGVVVVVVVAVGVVVELGVVGV
jgi:hypothetical protein